MTNKFVPRNTMAEQNASGKQIAYFPELNSNPQVQEYWADVWRFGTTKRTGTLEEFFRRRKESRDGHS